MKNLRLLPTALILFALLSSLGGVALAAERTFDQTYPLDAGGSVELSNINGGVTITGWDRNEVQVIAVISSKIDRAIDEVEVKVDASRGRISIESEYAKTREWRGHSATVQYTLYVPRRARLDEISLVNGSLHLEGIAGEVEASLVNGGLVAKGLAGNAELATVNGGIEAYFDSLSRDVVIESVNGPIDLYLPSGIDADVEASTVHGKISNDFGLEVDKSGYVGQELEGKIGAGGARISLENVNGPIRIHQR